MLGVAPPFIDDNAPAAVDSKKALAPETVMSGVQGTLTTRNHLKSKLYTINKKSLIFKFHCPMSTPISILRSFSF